MVKLLIIKICIVYDFEIWFFIICKNNKYKFKYVCIGVLNYFCNNLKWKKCKCLLIVEELENFGVFIL